MTSLFASLVLWFQQQSQSTQFIAVGGWSFLCGLLCASFFLQRFFQKQNSQQLSRQKGIAAYEKQAMEGRIAVGVQAYETIREQCGQLSKEKRQKSVIIDELRENDAQRRSENTRLQTLIEQERLRTEEKLSLLDEAREQLRLQFAELASSILEEKSSRFSQESQEKFSALLSPFHEQLESFRQKVDTIHHSETRDRAALQREISSLRTLTCR